MKTFRRTGKTVDGRKWLARMTPAGGSQAGHVWNGVVTVDDRMMGAFQSSGGVSRSGLEAVVRDVLAQKGIAVK